MSDIEFRVGDVYLFTVQSDELTHTFFNGHYEDRKGQQFLVEIVDGVVTKHPDGCSTIKVRQINDRQLLQKVNVDWLAPYTEDDE